MIPAVTRRHFIRNTARAALLITAGGLVKPLQALAGPAAPVVLRFAVFSDGHYGQKDTSFDESHLQLVEALNREKREAGLDFVIANGDLFHDNPAVVPALQQWYRQIEMPVYPSHGNHDMLDEKAWQAAFGQPYHYAFEKGDTAFVFLNTADANGKYIASDKSFAEAQFQKYKNKKHLFVVMHITPFAWTGAGFAQPELVPLFSAQKNLKAIFHGHDHDEDSYKLHEGKPYFFDGHTGGSWGVPYTGYRVVEVREDASVLLLQKDLKDERIIYRHALDQL